MVDLWTFGFRTHAFSQHHKVILSIHSYRFFFLMHFCLISRLPINLGYQRWASVPSSLCSAPSPVPRIAQRIYSTKACWLRYWNQVQEKNVRQEKWIQQCLQAETESANGLSFRFQLTARIYKDENISNFWHKWQSGKKGSENSG